MKRAERAIELKDGTDKELVASLRKGSKEAFEEILVRYKEKVGNLALRITRNAEDAEEILQDVFVTVFLKINNFQEKSAFSSWLYRITVNTAFMKLRKRKKHVSAALDNITEAEHFAHSEERSESGDVDYLSTRHEIKAQLEDALAKLPEDYRAIFVLRDIDGLSNQEVGEIMDLSVPAVKSRLHRSRLMLRKRLERYYKDYSEKAQIWFGPAGVAAEVSLQGA